MLAEGYGIRSLMVVPFPAGGVAGALSVLTRSGPQWTPATALAATSLAGYAGQALTVAARLDTRER